MGDNARAPYGPRSFEQVYAYTLQAVRWFFSQGCPLVVLACNTASAKALRSIQQQDLAHMGDEKRILGVIRPTAEVIGQYTKSGHVGVLGTSGTVLSQSYILEISKFSPEIKVSQEACPMWVPLIENNEYEGDGADFFVKKHINKLLSIDPEIDTILLGCTHYPLLINKIRQYVPSDISIVEQGTIVSESLKNYLARHISMEEKCSKGGDVSFYTTGDTGDFDTHAARFYGQSVLSTHLTM
jgi:glutamate racemase